MIKAYYIMRNDLNMSPAKLAISIGHGTDLIWSLASIGSPQTDISKWVNEFQRRKIVLKIDSLEKLENLKKDLNDRHILALDIVDNGLTEFNGKTVTGIVILPYFEDEVLQASHKFKRLQLWK